MHPYRLRVLYEYEEELDGGLADEGVVGGDELVEEADGARVLEAIV